MARPKRLPWDKWSWDAWRGDPRLGAASLAARGLWMEMLGIMREGSPVGYLKVGSKVILQGDLARLTRSLPEECAAAFSELEGLEVFSRDDETGCIFSRRMVRDEELRQKRAAGGRLGGNPALLKKPKDKPKVILEDKPKVTLKSSEVKSRDSEEPPLPPPRGETTKRKRTTDPTDGIEIPAALAAIGIKRGAPDDPPEAPTLRNRIQNCKARKKAATWQAELNRLAPLVAEVGRAAVLETWAAAVSTGWQGCTPEFVRDRAAKARGQRQPTTAQPYYRDFTPGATRSDTP